MITEKIVKKLLGGAYIIMVANRNRKLVPKLYSGNMSPEAYIPRSFMKRLKMYGMLKQTSNGRQVISRRAVQKLHGSDKIKIIYKQFLKDSKNGTTDNKAGS